ncbi:MAG: sel1 repeat family protein [Magnetococcales bacterium]|nr:sel1 repeat family protein [Magnetococcales bacterium]
MRNFAHALVVIAALTPSSVLGYSEPQDIADLHAAAGLGDAKAQVQIGWLYHEGRGVPQNEAEAAKWYLKAAEGGDVGAQMLIALMLALGEGVPRDDRMANFWFQKAASQSDPSTRLQIETLRRSVGK